MFGKLFPSSSSAGTRGSIPAAAAAASSSSDSTSQQQQDGMLTPKASANPTPNPFDTAYAPSTSTAAAAGTPHRTASQLSLSTLAGQSQFASARTPRSANATPGGSMSYHDGVHPRSSFFGPPTPGNVTPGGAAPVTPGGLATTSISRVEPDFSFTTQPSQMARAAKKADAAAAAAAAVASGGGGTNTPANQNSGSSALKGKLTVKLISARHLSAPSPAARPYVVVSFDQNEFVSREPIHEQGEEATGVPVAKGEAGGSGVSTPSRGQQAQQHTPMKEDPHPPSSSNGDPLSQQPNLRPPESALGRSLQTNGGKTPPPAPPLTLSSPPPPPTSMKLDDPTTPTAENGPSSSSMMAMAVSPDPRANLAAYDPALQNAPHNAHQQPEDGLSAYNPTWKHEVCFDVVNPGSAFIGVQIFDRSVEEECFLGLCEVRPRLVNGHVVDQWFKLEPRWDEETVTGEIRIQIRYEKLDVKKGLRVNDFDFLRMIGKGTFGRVFQVRKKDTHRIYAMKVLSKREIIAKKEVAHTIGERKILQRSSDSPFLLGLKFSFQSETDLYLVMDYKCGGELFHHLQKEGRFTEDRARFYTAEITLAFEHLHKFDIVYRDLKPENILLDATGHIVLCDFGLSKPDLPSDALTNTFCGTTEYLAPEVLLDDHGYSKLVDFWSLGVLLFEMCCGWSPFYAEDTQQMYKLICFGKVKFPRGVIGEDGKQFVKGLLNRNPKHRLGATRDAAELKEHAFFKSIDWDALALRQIPPPFKPYVDSDESVANFDPEFTEADLFEEAPRDVYFDEDDPSADWLDAAAKRSRSGLGGGSGTPGHAAATAEMDVPTPMEIQKPRRPAAPAPGEALTNSVQENFRGFTFSGEGESLIHQAAGIFANTHIHPPTPPGSDNRNRDHSNSNGNGSGHGADSDGWEDDAAMGRS